MTLARHRLCRFLSVSIALGVCGHGNDAASRGDHGGLAAHTTFNLADHGASGDAASDNAALAMAVDYAASHPGTNIHIPPGSWAFTVGSLFGFQFPSDTTVSGAGASATRITWNDDDGYYLFTASSNTRGSRRTHDITFRDFAVFGTWGTATPRLSAWQLGNNALIPGGVDGLVIERIASVNSRGFGIAARGSTDVSIRDNRVSYADSDGINASQCSNLSISGNTVIHTDDDGISAHSDIFDTWGVRRNVSIVDNILFDTQGIDVYGARGLLVASNNIDTVRQKGISIVTVLPGVGLEGNSATDGVVITGNKITNILDRYHVDRMNQNAAGISVHGTSARRGTYPAIPGEATPSTGRVVDPYPEFMANSTDPRIPTAAGSRILIADNLIARTLPATNGADPRFKRWSSLGQGLITSRLGPQDPMLSEADLQGPGVYLSGGDLRNVLVVGNIVSGMSYGLAIDGSGHMADLAFRGNTVDDVSKAGVLLNTTGSAELVVESNLLNIDPYQKSTARGPHGTWTGGGPIAFLRFQGGNLIVRQNTILNAAADTNVDPTDPTSGWLFDDNVDEADPQTVNTYAPGNRGIGLVHNSGFRLIQLDSDPASKNYDTVLSIPVTSSASMPTKGFWIPGERVANVAVGSTQPYSEWIRATIGTRSILGLDWIGVPVRIGKSAVNAPGDAH